MPLDWTLLNQDAVKSYLDENKSAEHTVGLLKRKHGVSITIRQFKHKFRRMKNIRADEWVLIGHEIAKRQAQSQAWAVYLHGRQQDPKRVQKETGRYKKDIKDMDISGIDWGIDTIGQHRIEIRTPASNTTTELLVELPDGKFHSNVDIEMVNQNLDLRTPTIQSPAFPETSDFTSILGCGLGSLPATRSPSVSLHAIDNGQDFNDDLWLQYQALMPHNVSLLSVDERNPWTTSPPIVDPSGLPKIKYRLFWDSEDITCILAGLRTQGSVSGNFNRQISGSVRVHSQPFKGEHGWLSSHLIATDQRLEVLQQTANQIEQILGGNKYSGTHQLDYSKIGSRFIESAFIVLTYLASNNLIDLYETEGFLISAANNGFISELVAYLQKRGKTTIPLQVKILQALGILSSFVLQSPSALRTNLWEWYPSECSGLLSIMDKRLLAGSFGKEILRTLGGRGYFEAARILIQADAYLGSDTYGNLLNHAVEQGDLDMLSFMTRAGDRVCLQPGERLSNLGREALATAVQKGRLDCVTMLLEAGVAVRIEYTFYGDNMLDDAKRASPEIYELLQSHLVHDEESEAWFLVKAAERGNRAMAMFINENDKIQDMAVAFESALWHAVQWREKSAVRTLLHRRVDANAEKYRTIRGVAGVELESDPGYWHPLELAIRNQDDDMVFLLVKGGAQLAWWLLDDLESDHKPLLITLAQAGHDMSGIGIYLLELFLEIAEFPSLYQLNILLEAGCPLNEYGPVRRRAAIQTWGGQSELHVLQFLIDKGAYVNLPANDSGGRTALQAAAEEGKYDIVNFLLEAGADIHAAPATENGLTVLEAAAKNASHYANYNQSRYLEMAVASFKNLMAFGAPANHADGGSGSLLHWLVLGPTNECLKTALAAGAKVDDQFQSVYTGHDASMAPVPMTALQVASNSLNLEAMTLLIQKGADVNAPASSDGGLTALQAVLVENRVSSRLKPERSLDAQTNAIELLLHCGADINAAPADAYGRTALQSACSRAQPSLNLVELLLEKGANVNAAPASTGGVTALQAASITGDTQLVKLLLEHEADASQDSAAKEGRTAVEGAAEHGRSDIVWLLLNNGARPDIATGFCKAVRLAKDNCHLHISDLLEQHQIACGLQPSLLGGRTDEEHNLTADMQW